MVAISIYKQKQQMEDESIVSEDARVIRENRNCSLGPMPSLN
jgi:hypothetical protein